MLRDYIIHARTVYICRTLPKVVEAMYRLNRQRLLRKWRFLLFKISLVRMPLWPASNKEGEARHSWHKLPLSIGLLFVSIFVLSYWGCTDPFIPPGDAVTALAVAAALMTLLGEMGGWEKMAWIFVLFGFLSLELHAIKIERTSQEEIQEMARSEQIRHFGEISRGIQKSIERSDRDFNATMEKSNRVIGLQNKAVAGLATNLNTLTGAESFCFCDLLRASPI